MSPCDLATAKEDKTNVGHVPKLGGCMKASTTSGDPDTGTIITGTRFPTRPPGSDYEGFSQADMIRHHRVGDDAPFAPFHRDLTFCGGPGS
jgi:hypothetical protein